MYTSTNKRDSENRQKPNKQKNHSITAHVIQFRQAMLAMVRDISGGG
jgi:hypothetical protein